MDFEGDAYETLEPCARSGPACGEGKEEAPQLSSLPEEPR